MGSLQNKMLLTSSPITFPTARTKVAFNVGVLPHEQVDVWCTSSSSSGDWQVLTFLQRGLLTWILVDGRVGGSVSHFSAEVNGVPESPCSVASIVNVSSGVVSIFTYLVATSFTRLIYVKNADGGGVKVLFRDDEPAQTLLPQHVSAMFTAQERSSLRVTDVWQWHTTRLHLLLAFNGAIENGGVLVEVACEGVGMMRHVFSVPIPPGGISWSGEGVIEKTNGSVIVPYLIVLSSEYSELPINSRFGLSTPEGVLPFLFPSLHGDGLVRHIEFCSQASTEGVSVQGAPVTPSPVTSHAANACNGLLGHSMSAQSFLSEAFRSVFSTEGEFLSNFPWVLEHGSDCISPQLRDAAAYLWPIFSEAVATADDWRYSDLSAQLLVEHLLTLCLPFSESATHRSVHFLSAVLHTPNWAIRSFLIMRDMLPGAYAEVMLWYLLYCRISQDVPFHESIPPISTLLHPDVDLAALRETVAAVVSNVQDEREAEDLFRGLVDDLVCPMARRSFLSAWWRLPFPMRLDPVAYLYAEFADLSFGDSDTVRVGIASFSLAESFIVKRVLQGADLDWLDLFSTAAPFCWSPDTLSIVAALDRIVSRCVEHSCTAAIGIERDTFMLLHSVTQFLSFCCRSSLADDIETQERYHVGLLRSVFTSGFLTKLLKEDMTSTAALEFALFEIGTSKGRIIDFAHAAFSDIDGHLPPLAQLLITAVVKEYVSVTNLNRCDITDGAATLRGEDTCSQADAGFMALCRSGKSSWCDFVHREVRRNQPLAPTAERILDAIGEGSTPLWRNTRSFFRQGLVASPVHYSRVLERELSVFDFGLFLTDLTSLPVAVAVLCELFRSCDEDAFEGRIQSIVHAVGGATEAYRVLVPFVVVSTLFQRYRGSKEDGFYTDLLSWRLKRYASDGMPVSVSVLTSSEDVIGQSCASLFDAYAELASCEGRRNQLEWYHSHFVQSLGACAIGSTDCALTSSEVLGLERDAREVLLEREELSRKEHVLNASVGRSASVFLENHRLYGEWCLSSQNLLLAELWERRSLVLMGDYVRYQEHAWMNVVGQLWVEISSSRASIEEEEDLVARDSIAELFAMESYRISRHVDSDAFSSDEDSDWNGDNDDDPRFGSHSAAFSSTREGVRSALVAVGLK